MEVVSMEVCEDPEKMSEVPNKNFQKQFTTESEFKKLQTNEKKWDVGNQEW